VRFGLNFIYSFKKMFYFSKTSKDSLDKALTEHCESQIGFVPALRNLILRYAYYDKERIEVTNLASQLVDKKCMGCDWNPIGFNPTMQQLPCYCVDSVYLFDHESNTQWKNIVCTYDGEFLSLMHDDMGAMRCIFKVESTCYRTALLQMSKILLKGDVHFCDKCFFPYVKKNASVLSCTYCIKMYNSIGCSICNKNFGRLTRGSHPSCSRSKKEVDRLTSLTLT
jgi:hypothetical protein